MKCQGVGKSLGGNLAVNTDLLDAKRWGMMRLGISEYQYKLGVLVLTAELQTGGELSRDSGQAGEYEKGWRRWSEVLTEMQHKAGVFW